MGYRQQQIRTEKIGTLAALACTVAVHAGVAVFGVSHGLTYLYPPPPEQTFVIDFSQTEEEKKPVVQQHRGSAPRVEEPDRTKPIELARRSEAQELGSKENKAPEATVDDFGDVEKPEPAREKPIEKRALFHAASNKADKDTLAPQTASKISESLKEGHAKGNTVTGKSYGTPNAHLEGRSTKGRIPEPSYNLNERGVVVVTIWVDQYGNVKKAQPGAPGTTVNNSTLWAAARKAAMETYFNIDDKAPALQKGQITYEFQLKK